MEESTAHFTSLIEQMRSHLGYVEGHHGDALTDFGTRLAAIEEKHGRALMDLVAEIRALKLQTGGGTREQPRAPAKDTLVLPPQTFLGDMPERYGAQFARYRAEGGQADSA